LRRFGLFRLRAARNRKKSSDFVSRSPRRSAQKTPRYVSLNKAALNELVAQLVEQRPFKAWVLGSNPSELTTPGRLSIQKLSALSLKFATQKLSS
jgi:hypothetical protein